MKTLKFTKMHGLGDDFMVVDGISQTLEPKETPLSAQSDRFRGVGLDQLLLMERPSSELVDFRYRIFNADGGEVGQCGNGARCFIRFVTDKGLTGEKEVSVETAGGVVVPRLLENGLVTVDTGQPRFMPSEVPFVPDSGGDSDALTHIILVGLESTPVSCVNVGSPHAVTIVKGTETVPVGQWGKAIESHERFPEWVNIGFMQMISRREMQLRAYEHGTEETQVCDTGACATMVADVRLGLLGVSESIKVMLPGGDLFISQAPEGGVMMTGPTGTIFEGKLQY